MSSAGVLSAASGSIGGVSIASGEVDGVDEVCCLRAF